MRPRPRSNPSLRLLARVAAIVLASPLVLRAQGTGAAATPGADSIAPLHAGGSNYPFYDVAGYLRNPTEAGWFVPGALHPVVGTYHEDSATVIAQLAAMYAAGQRRIALVVWFDDLSDSPRLRDWPVYGHTVNARRDSLLPRHAANLRALVAHVRALGYEQLIVRFAGQGQSRPKEWTHWNEATYQRNRRFIWSTIALIDRARGSLPVLYDLDVEGGGIDTGQQRPYIRRLWGDYVRAFPVENSIGVSVAASARLTWRLGASRLETLIADFDSVGRQPGAYAVDIYEWPQRSLLAIGETLRTHGAGAKPIIILESYYDDVETCEAVAHVRAAGRLNVVAVFQWPLARGAATRHVSTDFARSYGAWAALARDGRGVDPTRCARPETSGR